MKSGAHRAKRRPWTKREDAVVRRDYPKKKTADIAAALGRGLSGIYQRAYGMGLEKSAAFRASSESGRLTKLSAAGIAFRYAKGHVPANAGLRRPGWAPGRMAATQFKKGRLPSESRNYKPIGSYRICAEGLLERKVTDDPKIVPARRWVGVHRLVWSAVNGPIPAGHAVVFKHGSATTDIEKITIDAVELVSRPELMRRNSYRTNYPPEIG